MSWAARPSRTAALAVAFASVVGACGDDGHAEEALFVVSAPEASFDGSTLTLFDVPAVLYFANRPERDVGHISTSRYVELWTPRADDSDPDPPNAELSRLTEAGSPAAVVMILQSVTGDGSTLTFSVDLLEGELPETTDLGPIALYVDACDPASPYCQPYS